MSWKLKSNQQDFEMVDGPHEGQKFVRSGVYETVPPSEEWRFEKAAAAPAFEPEKADVVTMPRRKSRAIEDQSA